MPDDTINLDTVQHLRAKVADLRARAWIAGAPGVAPPPEVAHFKWWRTPPLEVYTDSGNVPDGSLRVNAQALCAVVQHVLKAAA